CVFQLLIFFMLSSSFMTPMIRLTLPQAATEDPSGAQEILVTVDAQGHFFLNTQPIAPQDLAAGLRPLIARSRHKVVTFRGDETMRYEWFVRALDAARSGGAVDIDIAHHPLGP
ncbi:MAG TPA: biopolymer transporter ExbD, partial [Isosphaeraceae bacterium]